MQEFLLTFSQEHYILIYIAIIVLAIIEGPILSILLGSFIELGYLPFLPTFIVLMLGDILGDVIWYGLGRFFGFRFVRRFGEYFSVTPERIKIVEGFYHTYHKSILIISKLTTGFGFAVPILFTAGLVKIPFRTYFLINTVGQIFWTALLVGAGYYFSELLLTFDSVLARLSIIAGFGILIAAFLGFSNYIKKRITRTSHT